MNGTGVGLAFALITLVAAAASVGIFWVIVLFLISMLISFLNMLTLDLQGMENGCPAMGSLGRGLELIAFIAGLFGAAGVALGAWISFLGGGAVGSSVGACKALNR